MPNSHRGYIPPSSPERRNWLAAPEASPSSHLAGVEERGLPWLRVWRDRYLRRQSPQHGTVCVRRGPSDRLVFRSPTRPCRSHHRWRSVSSKAAHRHSANPIRESSLYRGSLTPDDAIPCSKGATPEGFPKRFVPRPPRSKRVEPGRPPPSAFSPGPDAYLRGPAQELSIANAADTASTAAGQPGHSLCLRVFVESRPADPWPESARSRCIPQVSLPDK